MNLSKTNVMIDLETFGTRPNSVIISIGAVKFTAEGISDTFFMNVNPADGQAAGLKISQDTLTWWKNQKEDVLKQSLKNAIPLKDGLEQFVKWYGTKSLDTWAKGAIFDIPIMEANFDAFGMTEPWKFWHVKCHRTIAGLDTDHSLLPKAQGDLHNALVDATLQAEHLIAIWNSMNA